LPKKCNWRKEKFLHSNFSWQTHFKSGLRTLKNSLLLSQTLFLCNYFSLSLSLSDSLSLSLSDSKTLSLRLFLSQTLSHSDSLSLSYSIPLTQDSLSGSTLVHVIFGFVYVNLRINDQSIYLSLSFFHLPVFVSRGNSVGVAGAVAAAVVVFAAVGVVVRRLENHLVSFHGDDASRAQIEF
jgi:hypothetical protein